MESKDDLERFNKYLYEKGGTSPKNIAYPRFRLVFSDESYEPREFKHREYLYGVPVEGLVQASVAKYPLIKDRRVVFEIHFPTDNPELLDQNGNFEPLYIFENDNGALPVDYEILDFLIHTYNQAVVKKSESDFDAAEERQMKQAENLEFDNLDNELPYLATMLNNKEAVFVDSSKRFDNERSKQSSGGNESN